MKSFFYICIMLFGLFLKPAMATCAFTSDSPIQKEVIASIPLSVGNITAGAEIPNGTVLYRQTYRPGYSNAATSCTDRIYDTQFLYTSTPKPLSSWNGSPYGGKVYETGVPGIGVAFWRSGDAFPKVFGGGCSGSSNCIIANGLLTWDISLIKIGNITPGTILGSNLPCMNESLGNVNSPVSLLKACFSGTINVVSRTCTTPDVTVNMSKHDISVFRATGSTTEWVDASIKLTDCPVFYGTADDGDKNSWSENGTISIGAVTANKLGVTLTPNTSVLQSSNGVFALSESADSASGIGIQLAYGTSASQTPVTFLQEKRYTMTLGSSGSVNIPLVARYIQTESRAQPGKANSAVTFLISYY
ncbi:hypothetical protein DA103_11625 [Enterobacter cloacae]|uniref:MrkD-like receptor binding domain-containing protein n=1 Tax=Enterobacter cloacae TaxID=550 RepID=A0A2T4Y048_ENTCL|nr:MULTISPECIES: fimbrial protein [Enterobacter]MBM1020178.1 fimbrial protein [Enterobacter sp. E1]MEA3561479.1 fimbrial protein [Enterobacter sp. GM-22]MEA3595224.1 fimbrial protein [Enterobacter sp. GM-31]PTM35548.1 hypothetical protein DA103_11625 [Enterobacter cloacae]TFF60360.1 hypothetical protein EIC82_04065 [Enterobacter sp. A11]